MPLLSPKGATSVENHIDVDSLIEDYTWRMFQDMVGFKKAGLESYKHLEREEVEFVINRKKLALVHLDPAYHNIQLTGTRPNTIFKSVFTNNTSQPQSYSLKTERTSESICGVVREQGFQLGMEAELTLKTPCEIAELKTGFKHEIHFNTLTENMKSEQLTWGVDSSIMVPAGGQTEAAIVIEEMSYHGSYTLTSTLSGTVTVSIKRVKDGNTVLVTAVNIATVIQHFLSKPDHHARLKAIASLDQTKVVRLTSKGQCHFQFAMKQYVELTENREHKDLRAEMKRLNFDGGVGGGVRS